MDKLIDLFWFLLDLLGRLIVGGVVVVMIAFVVICVLHLIDKMSGWIL